MQAAYNVLLFLAIVVAVVFGLLVLITGKGDAMSGGGGVRTTFKGKASFDDQMSKLTLMLGTAFFVLMLLIDAISNRMDTLSHAGTVKPVANASAPAPAGKSSTSVPVSAPVTVPAQAPAGAPAKPK